MASRGLTRRALLRAAGAGGIVAAAPWLLNACSGGAQQAVTATATAAPRPTVRLAGGDYGRPTPFMFSRGPGHVNTSYVFDTLAWHDSRGVIPWLATSWAPEQGGRAWTFSLRPDVKWQDGQPFTADDVVFTFEYLAAHPTPWWASSLQVVAGAEKVTETSIRLRLKEPYAPLIPSIATSVFILPRHVWEPVSDPTKFDAPSATVGTGPYRLQQYNEAQGSYLFEANDSFFLGRPYVRRIEQVPAPNELLALQQGGIDAGGLGFNQAAPPGVLDSFKRDNRFKTISSPLEWTFALFFNMAKGGPLADVRFRQAVGYALNLDDLVARFLQGQGVVGNPGQVAPTSPWHNPRVPQYPFDTAKAQRLLDDAGYLDRDHDGVRETATGTPLRFPLILANSDPIRVAELLQSYLKAAGIQVTPQVMDGQARDSAAAQGRYDLALVGFGGLGGDPDGLRAKFDSHSKSKSFTRVHGYANPTFDSLAAQQLSTIDEAARKAIVDRMQVILAQDLPTIDLYYPTGYWIYRAAVLDAWYFAHGWYGSGTNGCFKQVFVTGQPVGTQIRGAS